jgi:formylglycine-generating enzyme required for sulfatase activity
MYRRAPTKQSVYYHKTRKTMNTLHSRYPGARPFETDQQLIFRGRQADTEAVFRLIQLETLTVLYGKSGTGKSSLLNAGVIPKVKAGTDLLPVRVRFNAYREDGGHMPPASTARLSVRGGTDAVPTFLDRLIPDEATLWHDVKEHYIRHEGKKGLLLVIDQFEELFTYPAEEVQAFGEQLAEALFKTVPQRYWDLLQAGYARGERPLGPEELALFQNKPALKVVLSIRSDRLHLLDRLDGQLPTILKNLYELDALGPEAARQAIVEPAAMLKMDLFDTEPFLYDPAAVERIIDFLTRESGADETGDADDTRPNIRQKIEATQLQIICAEVEARVKAGRLRMVLPEHVGDLETVIERYYDTQIQKLDPAEQLPARRLIEEGLVFEEEERRLSLYEGQIFKTYKIQSETLRKLVDAHLLRAEPSLAGGYTYELSHDTLVAPVLKAKRIRLEQERREEEARLTRLREEELAAEKAEIERRRRKAMITAIVAGALVLAAAVATGFAIWQSTKAADAIRLADEKTREAAVSDSLAQVKTSEAEHEKREADRARNRALEAQKDADEKKKIADAAERKAQEAIRQSGIDSEIARLARLEAEQKKQEAEEAARIAEIAKAEALEAAGQAVTAILAQSRQDILRLDYEAAFAKMKNAAALEAFKDSVAFELMEVAFFHHHTDNPDRAREPFDLAAGLLGKPPLAGNAGFEGELRRLDADRSVFLQRRYFPFIQSLPGGAFLMGRDSTIKDGGDDELPRHEVRLDPFGMAQTETTFWQWNLYIASKGRDIQRYSPSWGVFGDNPAVYLDWFDACEYANWLSEREGKRPFYRIDSVGIESRYEWQVTLLPGGDGYRLPTEAEWEYAGRGGPGAPYYTYAGHNIIDSVGWYNQNSRLEGINRTHPVRGKMPVTFPNGARLYDLSGNAWEWCWDAYDESYYERFRMSPAINPVGPEEWNIIRVVRGGSWDGYGYNCRVADRYGLNGNYRDFYVGFRVVRHQD